MAHDALATQELQKFERFSVPTSPSFLFRVCLKYGLTRGFFGAWYSSFDDTVFGDIPGDFPQEGNVYFWYQEVDSSAVILPAFEPSLSNLCALIHWQQTGPSTTRIDCIAKTTEGESRIDSFLHTLLYYYPDSTRERDSASSGRVSTPNRPPVYKGANQSATIAHWLIKQHGRPQRTACELTGISPDTYRKIRDSGKLLSEAEFKRQTGWSIAYAAEKYLPNLA